MKINVLSTDYAIEDRFACEDSLLAENSGYCDDSVKKIVLRVQDPEQDSKKDLEAVRRKVLRHETVHAFLCESVLTECNDWAQNEEFVDWLAIQGPKIYNAWKEAGAV